MRVDGRDAAAVADAAARLAAGELVAFPDRDGLRPRRPGRRRRGGREDLRAQGPADRPSADRPRRRPGRGGALRRDLAPGRTARRGVLARAGDGDRPPRAGRGRGRRRRPGRRSACAARRIRSPMPCCRRRAMPAFPAWRRRAPTASAGSARPAPRTCIEEFGDELLVLDGGAAQLGIESAIVDCSRDRPALLRPGVLTRERLEAALGAPLAGADVAAPRAPGTLEVALRAARQAAPDADADAPDRPRGARIGPAEAGGIFPVGAFGRGDGRSPPAHAGPPGAGGARTICRAARTRQRRRASHLGRGATAGSRMGRRQRPAQPRRGNLNSRFLELYSNETDCEASAPCGDGLRRAGCDAAAGLLRRQRADFGLPPGPHHRLRRRDQQHPRHRRQLQRPQVQRQRHRLGGPTAIDCRGNPIWIQTLAAAFGNFVFPTCNPAGSAVFDPPNRIRATVGARAADLAAQIDAQLAENGFRDDDLVTVLVGANDVLSQYTQYPAVSEVQLTANVEAAGTRGRPAGQSPGQRRRQGHRRDHPRRQLLALRARREGGAHRHRPAAPDPAAGAEIQRGPEAGAHQRRPSDRPGAARRGGAPGGELPGHVRHPQPEPRRSAISASRS